MSVYISDVVSPKNDYYPNCKISKNIQYKDCSTVTVFNPLYVRSTPHILWIWDALFQIIYRNPIPYFI